MKAWGFCNGMPLTVRSSSYFSQTTGFDISCKLSPLETICMKLRILFSEKKNKKNVTNLPPAELAQGVVKVNTDTGEMSPSSTSYCWAPSEKGLRALHMTQQRIQSSTLQLEDTCPTKWTIWICLKNSNWEARAFDCNAEGCRFEPSSDHQLKNSPCPPNIDINVFIYEYQFSRY